MDKHPTDLEQLRAATTQMTRALKQIQRSAAALSSQDTSTLYGVAGGLLGLSAAYTLSLLAPISLAAVGVILTGLGIVGGVLWYRGRRRIRMEASLDANRLALDEILRRIQDLPPDTPPSVRDQMWLTYSRLNSSDLIFPAVAIKPDPNGKTQDKPLVRGPPNP